MTAIKDQWESPDGSVRLLLGDCLPPLGCLSRAKHRKGAWLAAMSRLVLVSVSLVVVFFESTIEAGKNSSSAMRCRMLFSCCEFEIGGRVVSLVAVPMVNKFRRQQFASKNALHNDTMFPSSSVITVNFGSQHDIPIACCTTGLKGGAGVPDRCNDIVM